MNLRIDASGLRFRISRDELSVLLAQGFLREVVQLPDQGNLCLFIEAVIDGTGAWQAAPGRFGLFVPRPILIVAAREGTGRAPIFVLRVPRGELDTLMVELEVDLHTR